MLDVLEDDVVAWLVLVVTTVELDVEVALELVGNVLVTRLDVVVVVVRLLAAEDVVLDDLTVEEVVLGVRLVELEELEL